MRIGVMCHASVGGSARIGIELALELARRGHTVHLFTRRTPFIWPRRENGVILHRLIPDGKDELHPAALYTEWTREELESFLSKVLRVIRAEKLDIIHFHYAVPFAFIAQEVKRRMGSSAPLMVGTLHGTDVSIHGRDPEKGPRLARALEDMDGLTTVSRAHARLTEEVFGPRVRPTIIPNFLDFKRFRPPDDDRRDKSKGMRNGKTTVAHVSNFRPIKDPHSMARIFSGIRKHMAAELWLIGDGPEMEPVKEYVRQEGIEADIRYWGIRLNVDAFLSQADLLVVSSKSESFCLVALEAMACGVPVLAPRVGGLPEVVIDGKAGLLYPPGDVRAAVKLAINLLSDPERHRFMREAAAVLARRFDQQKVVSHYEEMYRTLLLSS